MKTYLKCKRCHHEEEVFLHEIEHRVKTVLCEWCGVEDHYEVIRVVTIDIGPQMVLHTIEQVEEIISNMLDDPTREALPLDNIPDPTEADYRVPSSDDGIYDTDRSSNRSRPLPPTLDHVRRHMG
jgi:transcription elongation factor Elf1